MCYKEKMVVLYGENDCVIRRKCMCYKEKIVVLYGENGCVIRRKWLCYKDNTTICPYNTTISLYKTIIFSL